MIARNLVKTVRTHVRVVSHRNAVWTSHVSAKRLTYLVCTCSLESSMFISESVARRGKAKQSEVVLKGISQVQSQRGEVNESKGAGAKMINLLESKVRPDVTCRRAVSNGRASPTKAISDSPSENCTLPSNKQSEKSANASSNCCVDQSPRVGVLSSGHPRNTIRHPASVDGCSTAPLF